MFPPGDNYSIELEVTAATSHTEHHMPLNQQAKKKVTVMARVIGPAYHWEFGLLLHGHCYSNYQTGILPAVHFRLKLQFFSCSPACQST